MRVLQIHILLTLVSTLIRSAMARALPPRNPAPLIIIEKGGIETRWIGGIPLQSQCHERRAVGGPSLVPGFPNRRIAGLPSDLVGVFADITSIRSSIPAAKLFIQFFRIAAMIAANDPRPERWVQRIVFGDLIFEVWNQDPAKTVTKELVEATSLWLLNMVQSGWTALFVARVLDKVSQDTILVRLMVSY